MKHILTTIAFLITSLVNAQSPVDSRQQTIVFKDVSIIPMDTERVLEHQDVVVTAGKIAAMGATRKVTLPKDALVVPATGKYLIPGLAEMHAHVPPVDDLTPMKDVLQLFAVNGVTTIRGMLGHPRHIELRDKIRSGEILGPHFYTSGPSFNGLSIKTPEQADKMVREQKQMGYDFLKLHPGLTLANFNAVVKTAKEVNIPFAGHVSTGVGVWRAMDAGYATIDHMDGFIEGLTEGAEAMTDAQIGFFGLLLTPKVKEASVPKLVNGLQSHHIWVVPTQCLAERWIAASPTTDELKQAPEMKYMDDKTLNGWVENKNRQLSSPGYSAALSQDFVSLRRRLIKSCQQGGVKLLLGSDAPQVFNVPGFSIHYELRYLVAAGLTPYEALRTGTVNVAEFYHQPNAGTIRTGNMADLVLLQGNPLRNISETSKIEGVMLDGRWLSKAYIDQTLRTLARR